MRWFVILLRNGRRLSFLIVISQKLLKIYHKKVKAEETIATKMTIPNFILNREDNINCKPKILS